MRRWLPALLLVTGCFTPDLGDGQVACGVGGACPPDYVCRSDGRCWHDAGDSADLGGAGGGCGSDGTRLCVDALHSGVCQSGHALVDRACPPTSACSVGHCMPPAGARPCARAADCTGGEVCDEYVVAGGLAGYCTPPVAGASGGLGASCAVPAWDDGCATGVCAGDGAQQRACLYPCKGKGDCNDGSCVTVGAPVTLEGAPTATLKFCASAGG